jgi:hypothetical protein
VIAAKYASTLPKDVTLASDAVIVIETRLIR